MTQTRILWLAIAIPACTDGAIDPLPSGSPDADLSTEISPDAGEVGTSGCTGLGDAPADQERSIESSGRTRRFLIHVPDSYDPEVRSPVVLNFHGLTHDAERQRELSKMDEVADRSGFIVVYPDGVSNSWNAGYCCGQAASSDVDDVQFVRDLLDDMTADLCVDESRIYATGMSNGGHFSYRLACDLSDRIAGIAPVAGRDTSESCSPGRSMPVIHFHGLSDIIVPFNGSVTASVEAWAERNGCADTTTEVFSNGDSTCEQYDGCADGAAVTLCTVEGGGHTWPGGTPLGLGKTTDDLSASDAMWEFWTEQAR